MPQIYHLLGLCFLLLASCSNPNFPNPKSVEESFSNATNLTESQPDSMLKLKYTSMIYAIFEDSKGNFWFGSDLEGVCRYDGTSFTYFDERDGLSNNQVRSIQEDDDGKIWFTTGKGISNYDGEKISTPTDREFIILPQITGLEWQKTPSNIWLGNGDQYGGIYRYDGKNLAFLKFPVLDRTHDSFSIPGPVTGVSTGQDNRVWIASYSGVLGYDGISFLYVNKRGIDYHVRSVFEDSKGGLWIGNNGIGVLYYDGESTINFTKKHGLNDEEKPMLSSHSPPGTLEHVFAIAEDRKGNIWFGDRDTGAWSYDGASLTNYTTANGLSNIFVRVIYTDKSGDLWIGMKDGGLAKFNGESFDSVF